MKNRAPVFVALLLAVSMIVCSLCIAANAAGGSMFNPGTGSEDDASGNKYDNISINDITGVGSDPEEITGEASAAGVEKQWYEYITYSPNPVASVRIDDDQRLLFYDPYDYNGAMIMEIDYLETEWGTYSSISKTITQSSTLNVAETKQTSLTSSTQHQDGLDQTLSSTVGSQDSIGNSISVGTNTTDSWSNQVNMTTTVGLSVTEGASGTYSDKVTTKVGAEEEFGKEGGLDGILAKVVAKEEISTETSGSLTTSLNSTDSASTSVATSAVTSGSTTDQINSAITSNVTGSESKTSGWSIVADRITTSLGSSGSTSRTWSTSESTSLTVNYAATHFTESGTPFSWNIAHYHVKMPMRCEKQYKIGGEWITTSSCYVELTTIEGTCRTWIQNSKTYYEDWGTGQPVTWEDFYSKFYFGEENLIDAYQNKLYPDEH
ncbi:MAG: hypothetical protein IJM71_05595 [Clostridia bacterium]|nr:hypothetical protein [Clostridia bacterium]